MRRYPKVSSQRLFPASCRLSGSKLCHLRHQITHSDNNYSPAHSYALDESVKAKDRET